MGGGVPLGMWVAILETDFKIHVCKLQFKRIENRLKNVLCSRVKIP
jgi:hypothetical protein